MIESARRRKIFLLLGFLVALNGIWSLFWVGVRAWGTLVGALLVGLPLIWLGLRRP